MYSYSMEQNNSAYFLFVIDNPNIKKMKEDESVRCRRKNGAFSSSVYSSITWISR